MSAQERQLALEEEYSTAAIAAGQQQVLQAFKQGRASDIGAGRLLLASAFESALEGFKVSVANSTSRGLHKKFTNLLKIADAEILVMAGLRELINACARPEPVYAQDFLRSLGRIIESESLLKVLSEVNSVYTDKTVQYLDSTHTKSVHHRYRTLLKGSENINLDWDSWEPSDRIGAAKLLVTIIYDATGLFRWATTSVDTKYILMPQPELAKHFDDVQAAAKAVIKYPPMLVKPDDWKSQYNGGYLTDWFRTNSPMCGLRFLKREHKAWILEGLQNERSQPLRDAMNKIQSTPYRINNHVLEVLRSATASRLGILGLPSQQPKPKPKFPFPEGWLKSEASPIELDSFKLWKQQMAAWYTAETERVGRQVGIVSKLREMVRYRFEPELYFPTFIDWRGRVYFRSNLNPQSNDAVKGCVEFAEGKRLGARGLFWLKVHVANSCGYDKHSAETKAKWVDENWAFIENFLDNPLDVDAPEADTAFSLLQAGYALQDALNMQNPEDYVCHVPIAMDATCSGLQHLAALTRDETGAYYTNLVDNGEDKKSDIYMQVAELADKLKDDYSKSPAISAYWTDKPIWRNLAKPPVMTFVYGATLLSTIDTAALNMADYGLEPIRDFNGDVAFGMTALATPVAKALREGVVRTVPEAAKMMKYLQGIVRRNKTHVMRWVTPVGVPVFNWAEGQVVRRVRIDSMGIVVIRFAYNDGKYNTVSAANGIVPNFVHSMDSAHLCLTINACVGAVLPIHDSFATHPCDVDDMHKALRSTFVKMYQDFNINNDLLIPNDVNPEEDAPPNQGSLDLNKVNEAPYMFC